MDLLDISIQEEYPILREQYLKRGQGFVLVYSVNNKSSFDEIIEFKEQICRVKGSDKVPIVLVGNKCDLDYERQITAQEGSERASEWEIPFFETSAKNRINVEESFFELVREIRRGNEQPKKPIKKIGNCQLL